MISRDQLGFLLRRLADGEPALLLLVVKSDGASPGRAGFAMTVDGSGELLGTIGGGAVEHRCVEEARAALHLPAGPPVLRTYTHGGDPGIPSGMICGGTQTVLFWRPSPDDAGELAQLQSAVPGMTLRCTPHGVRSGRSVDPRGPVFRETDTGWVYEEPALPQVRVYIVGGGHVGRALCRQLLLLDIPAVVLEERAAEVRAVALLPGTTVHTVPYTEAGGMIPDGPGTFVVIATPGHQWDELVARQLVSRPLGYLGVLASPAKAEELRRRLRDSGADDADLLRLRAPIGIPIGSQTPAEIAVSIAAEVVLIAHRGSP